MASDEEIFKIIAQVQGEEEVKRLTAAVEKQEKEILRLTAQLKAGAISQAQFAAASRQAADQVADAQRQIRSLQAANRDLGRATLLASQGLEDLRYGVEGVLNNIPGLLQSLGGSAGLAGVISMVAVGSKVLYDHWDELAGAFGAGHTKTEAEAMEELGKQTAKTADEVAKLAAYEEQRKNIAAQRGPTEGQSKMTGGLNDAIREAPEADFRRAIDRLHGDQLRNSIPQEIVDEREKAARDLKAALVQPGIKPAALAASQARDSAAQAAMDAAYNEARDKFQNFLVTQRDANGQPSAMRNFVQQAGEQGLLTQDAQKRLRASTLTPQQAKEKADQSARDKREWESELRLQKAADAKKEEEKKLRQMRDTRDFQSQERLDKADRDLVNTKAGEFADNASPAARKMVLEAESSGSKVDKSKLVDQIGKDLANAGVKKEDVEKFAAETAAKLMKETSDELTEQASKEGISKQKAAQAGLLNLDIDAAKRREEMMRTHLATLKTDTQEGKVMGSAEFARSLMTIRPGGETALAKKQLEEAQKMVAKLEQVRLGLLKGLPAVLGGGR